MQSPNLEPIYGMVVLATALRMLKRMGVAASAKIKLAGPVFHEESSDLATVNKRDLDVDSRALCAQCESALTEGSDFVDIPKWG